MNSIPLLQIAMDYTSLPKALEMAVLTAPEVDIIEIGTPLCKSAGVEAIRAMREICPDKLILADFKTPDVGGLEATMVYDAGGDMLTVIGGAATAHSESRRSPSPASEARRCSWNSRASAIFWREQSSGAKSASTASSITASGMPRPLAASGSEEDKDIMRKLIDMGLQGLSSRRNNG